MKRESRVEKYESVHLKKLIIRAVSAFGIPKHEPTDFNQILANKHEM